MKWVDDFPVMGNNTEPVLSYKKPNAGEEFRLTAKVSLEPRFEGEKFGLPVIGLDFS